MTARTAVPSSETLAQEAIMRSNASGPGDRRDHRIGRHYAVRWATAMGLLLLVRHGTLFAADITISVFGTNLVGTSRPLVVVVTSDNVAAAAATDNVGLVALFDTGADHFAVKPADATALELTYDAELERTVGGVEVYKGNPITEFSLVTKAQLQKLGALVKMKTIVKQYPLIDLFGSDAMIDGLIGVYDPTAAPVKDLAVYNGYTSANVRLSRVSTTFTPDFRLPVKNIRFGHPTDATKHLDPRPTLDADFKDVATAKTYKISGKKVCWDTGSPSSMIRSDMIKDAADKLKLDKKNGRVIIPEVRFTGKDPIDGSTDTLIIKDLQVVLNDDLLRDPNMPMVLGMNVLEKFKFVVDLHNDPKVDGDDQFFGLERKNYFRGKIKKGGKLIERATDGSRVVIKWTGNDGKPLDVVTPPKTIPVDASNGPYGEVEFAAPTGAEDFDQFVLAALSPLGPASNLTVEALAFTPGIVVQTVDGEVTLPDHLEIGSIWDAAQALNPTGTEIRLPDLYADTNVDTVLDSNDLLYSAVDLTATSTSVVVTSQLGADPHDPPSFDIVNGKAASLPGFVFGTQPIQIDYLAGQTDPYFINPAPFTGTAYAISEHIVVFADTCPPIVTAADAGSAQIDGDGDVCAQPPCEFDTNGDGINELVLEDTDGNGLCEFPDSKTHLPGTLIFQRSTPVEFRDNTVVEADRIIIEDGAVLRGEASTLSSLTLWAVKGDLVASGTLALDVADDLLLRAQGSLQLTGTTRLSANDRVKLEARQGEVLLTPPTPEPDDAFTVLGLNRVEIRARGFSGSVHVSGGARVGSRRIDVVTKSSLSEIGSKELRLDDGALLTTDPIHTGLAAGKLTLDSTGRILVNDGAVLDAGYRLTVRTRRAEDDVCLSGGPTLAAGVAPDLGKIQLTGVEGRLFDDGSTTFVGLVSSDGIEEGSCP